MLPVPPLWFTCLLIIIVVYLLFGAKTTPKDVPSPPGWYPFFGHLIRTTVNLDSTPDFLALISNEFRRTWCGSLPVKGLFYIVVDPENLEYVLKTNFNNYVKGEEFMTNFHEFLGAGIFSTDGAVWRHKRKVASRMFTQSLLREGTAVAMKHASRLIKQLDDAAERKSSINIQPLFFDFTIDVFGDIAFGFDSEQEPVSSHPFAQSFDKVQSVMNERFTTPHWKLLRMLKLGGEGSIRQNVVVLDKFAYQTINKRRAQYQSRKKGIIDDDDLTIQRPNIISRFLAAQDAADEEPLTDKQLRDIVFNFMIAGRDTTACSLTWLMMELARNPEVAQNWRNELKRVMHENQINSLEDLSYDILNQMTYASACVHEITRLYPAVPKQMKYAVNADVLPDGTAIPAKAMLVYSSYAMARAHHIWGDSADKFEPNRWILSPKDEKELADRVIPGYEADPDLKLNVALASPTLRKSLSPYVNPSFNANPRLCLGKPLAYLEIKLATSLILSKFVFDLVPDQDLTYKNTIVLPMKNGLELNIRRLQN